MDLQILNTTGNEPVTLQEVKSYLRVTNDQENTFITSLITNARMQVERYINSDIVAKERVLYLEEIDANEGFNLPYAPLNTTATFTVEVDGVEIGSTGYELKGLENPLVCLDGYSEKIKVTYSTKGLSDEGVKLAILACCAWTYRGRDAKMSTNWKAFASPFKVFGYYGTK